MSDIKIIVEPIDLDFLDDSTIIDTDIYDIPVAFEVYLRNGI